MSRDYKSSDVQPEDRFERIAHAFVAGYNAYQVALFPIEPIGGQQMTLFYAVNDHVAVLHCEEAFGSVSYRLYRLSLLSMNGDSSRE